MEWICRQRSGVTTIRNRCSRGLGWKVLAMLVGRFYGTFRPYLACSPAFLASFVKTLVEPNTQLGQPDQRVWLVVPCGKGIFDFGFEAFTESEDHTFFVEPSVNGILKELGVIFGR